MTKRASEAQIVKILEEFRSGVKAEDICRISGISKATLYNWRDKYGDMGISELKRIKQLEHENQKLKSMYAELSLRNEALKDIIAKKL
jgi:putative transposase